MFISDRTLGYLVLSLLALVLVGTTILMINKHRLPRYQWIVHFDEVGSLQPQDLVSMRGYPVGQVGSIKWRGNHAEVLLVLDEPRILHEGVVVRNENYSLMGQRRVEIVNPHRGRAISRDTILQGVFEPGIAEALHLMQEVQNQVILIRDLVLLLESGDSATPSLQTSIEDFAQATETLVDRLHKIVEQSQRRMGILLHNTTVLARQTTRITEETDSLLRHTQAAISAGIAETRALGLQMHAPLHRVTLFLDSLQVQPFYAQMVEDREVMYKLEEFAAALKKLTTFIDDKGLVLLDEHGNRRSLVKLRNINLIGKTAREKASQQQ